MMNLIPMTDHAKKLAYRTNSVVMNTVIKTMPFIFPTPKSEIGPGSAEKIPLLLQELNVCNVMIVTDENVRKLVLPPILKNLEEHGIRYRIYSRVEENPSVTTVERIRRFYLAHKCNGFLAVGGGSPMDAAKAAGARIARPRTPITKMAGMMRVLAKLPPLIAVPTTAGTGSEVSIGAVISDHDTHHKYAMTDPFLTPDYAVVDPLLTVTVPPFYTATTGIDVLTHAVESYITWTYNNNMTNRNCEEAIVKVFRYLEKAYADGSDLEAREQMLIASYKAGLAFTRTGVGYVHAIAHAMAGIYNTPHGLANAVILPIVLEDYGACVHPQLAHLAEITGIKTNGTDAEKAKAFIDAIRAMNARMGLPSGFDFLKPSDFPQIIKWALIEANHNYPVPVIYNEARCRHVLNRILLEA